MDSGDGKENEKSAVLPKKGLEKGMGLGTRTNH